MNGVTLKTTSYYRSSDYSNTAESTFNYTIKSKVRIKDAGGVLANDRIDCEKEIYGKDGSIICRKGYTTDGNGTLIGSETEVLRVAYDNQGLVLTMTDNALGTAQVYTNYYDIYRFRKIAGCCHKAKICKFAVFPGW